MGFARFSAYHRDGFDLLDAAFPTDREQAKYHDRWRSKYTTAMKAFTPEDIIRWDLRLYRSLKGLFASASCYLESQAARVAQNWTSFYFLSYYALYHALLSNVFLDPEETFKATWEITHSKCINVAVSAFQMRSQALIKTDLRAHFEVLRYAREYYSYQMPFNDFLVDDADLATAIEELPELLRLCCQSASFHSVMIEASARKAGVFATSTKDHVPFLFEHFNAISAPEHPITGSYILDPSDRHALDERIRLGCELNCFLVVFEHFFDEFGTYSNLAADRGSRVVAPHEVAHFVGGNI
jgi:hypothetical protein